MGLIIQGMMGAIVSINSQDIPFSSDPSTYIAARDNVKQLLPTLEFRVSDPYSFIEQTNVSDGSKISVLIGDGNTLSNPLNYLSFGSPKKAPLGNGQLYNIHGISTASGMLRMSVGASISGSSLSCFQKAASSFNLKLITNISSSNDSMVWRPGRQTWGTFLKDVANHAYTRDGGFVSYAVDSEGNLYFMDVPYVFAQSNLKAIIYQGNPQFSSSVSSTAKSFYCLQYKCVNRAGMHNNISGFGMRTSQTDPVNGGVNKYTNVTAQTSGNSLDINSSLYNTINPVSRISIPPINVGNGHDNYIKARHQNSRIGATYSNNLYVLMPSVTGLSLYDKVYFKAGDTDNYDKSSVGYYIVTGKVRLVCGGRYYEKIELTNTGPATGSDLL